jgi:hypothetical protein
MLLRYRRISRFARVLRQLRMRFGLGICKVLGGYCETMLTRQGKEKSEDSRKANNTS